MKEEVCDCDAAPDLVKIEGVNGEGDLDTMCMLIRTIAGIMLTNHWGERCPEFEECCLVCQKWKALDMLTDTLR